MKNMRMLFFEYSLITLEALNNFKHNIQILKFLQKKKKKKNFVQDDWRKRYT